MNPYQYILDDHNQILLSRYLGDEEKITLPEEIDGKKVVGLLESCFWGKTRLKEVVFADTITQVKPRCFRECSSLRRVVLSSRLFSLPTNTFTECDLLEEVTVTGDLIDCDKLAFEDSPLRIIRIHKGVNSLDTTLLHANASTIEQIVVEEGNPSFWADESALFEKNKKELIFCFSQKYRNNRNYDKGFYQVPKGTLKIGQKAFKNCYNLWKVNFSDCLVSIGQEAFKGSAVESFYLPASLREIQEEALQSGSVFLPRRKMLSQITVEAGNPLYWIEDQFLMKRVQEQKALVLYFGQELDVVVPQETVFILEGAFAKSSLRSLSLPDSIRSVAKNAFESCKKLTKVSCKTSQEEVYLPRISMGMDYMISQVREEYLSCICKQEEGRLFDYEKYDLLFSHLTIEAQQILVAICRLKSPVHLGLEQKKTYQLFLQEHLYNALMTTAKEDFSSLRVFGSYGLLGADNIDEMIAKANQEGHAKLQSYLMNYKNTHFGIQMQSYDL